ncbi:splicing factor 1 isoform X2 [Folsomia candida]|uniref:splicing factor 1 isoform X2 n=1 Tax=Folsomia candida TaxID=158441 RepID=UPI000B904DEB|nr:splicing factor 1 isoform X2 [Folsomia candida]
MSFRENSNKIPLGRPASSSSKPSSGSSLLKPAYLRGGGGESNSNDDYEPFTNHYFPNFPNPTTAAAVSSAVANITSSLKRDISRSHRSGFDDDNTRDSGGDRKRKRRSRWMGSEDEKAVFPGMPTILPPGIAPDKAEAYIAQLQIEELTRKLRTGDMGISPNPEERSPSPEPIYSTDGKRLNTRENRTRKKLEDDRHKLIQRLQELNPDYRPPQDYRTPVVKIVQEVPIPQEEHPEINFVGLLIGPRGNTLKSLVKETGAKIIIRGKGSVKEGKVGGKAGQPLPGEDQPLHAYVTSNNPESVKKACDKIREIIRQGIEMPESQNDLRKNQLRELALLNGTLRECEGPKCSNCGSTAHRTWNCPDKPNYTNSVVCTVCGGAGHLGKDCKLSRPGAAVPLAVNYDDKTKIDEEYLSLMAELGEGKAETGHRPTGGSGCGSRFSSGGLFDRSSAPKALMSTGSHHQHQPPVPPPSVGAAPPPLPPMMPPGNAPPPPPPGTSIQPSPPGMGWNSSYPPPPPPGYHTPWTGWGGPSPPNQPPPPGM